jgi:hypothetical protein
MFDAATIGGADALDRPDLGRLAPGAMADIVVFDLSNDRIGQVIDPIQTLLIDVLGRDVRRVFIAGRMVVVVGAIPGLDMHTANVRALAQFAGLMARYPERTVGHPRVDEILLPAIQCVVVIRQGRLEWRHGAGRPETTRRSSRGVLRPK